MHLRVVVTIFVSDNNAIGGLTIGVFKFPVGVFLPFSMVLQSTSQCAFHSLLGQPVHYSLHCVHVVHFVHFVHFVHAASSLVFLPLISPSRLPSLFPETRVLVAPGVTYLISPSENLVRVELSDMPDSSTGTNYGISTNNTNSALVPANQLMDMRQPLGESSFVHVSHILALLRPLTSI